MSDPCTTAIVPCLAARGLSDPGLSDPVLAPSGLSDPCLVALVPCLAARELSDPVLASCGLSDPSSTSLPSSTMICRLVPSLGWIPRYSKFFQFQYVPRLHIVVSDLDSSHISGPLTAPLQRPSIPSNTSDKPDCSSAPLLLGSVVEDIRYSQYCTCDHQSQHPRCEYHREKTKFKLCSSQREFFSNLALH